jgi:hypothetical protein
MSRIFISYRRDDTRAITGRIHDRLEIAFGDDNVFKDVDDIPPGSDFRQVLRHAIDECNVVLAVIGQRWLNAITASGTRRLDDPDDFVRFELAVALKRDDMIVIPVLVDGAMMPGPTDLPAEIRPLAFRNAVVVRHDPDFRRDIDRLVEQLNRIVTGQISTVRATTTAEMKPPPEYQAQGRGLPLVWVASAVLVIGALIALGVLAATQSQAPTAPPTLSIEDRQIRYETYATQVAAGEVPLGWVPGTDLVVLEAANTYSNHTENATVTASYQAGERVEVRSQSPYFFLAQDGRLWFMVGVDGREGWMDSNLLRLSN